MYDLTKNVISSGNFELGKMLNKINVLWAESNITDDERAELISFAQNKANVNNSINLYKVVSDQDKRIKVLEEKVALLMADDRVQDDNAEETTYDEYVAGKYYYNGDKVVFDSLIYTCIAPDGVVCVWSPTEYPEYWELA